MNKKQIVVTDRDKAMMGATIFAGMCSDELIMRWCREEQNKTGNGCWNDHMAQIAVESVEKILDRIKLSE